MSENYHDPVDHSTASSAVTTAAETVKGGVTGAAKGFGMGALITGLLGGVLFGGLFALFAPIGVALTVGVIAGIMSGAAGAVIGTPVGAATGAVRGVSDGRDKIAHDRGAAQLMETERQQAQAQAETAQALKAQIIKNAMDAQQQAEQPVVVPMSVVSHMQQHGQPLLVGNPAETEQQPGGSAVERYNAQRRQDGYAQHVQTEQADAAQADPQMG